MNVFLGYIDSNSIVREIKKDFPRVIFWLTILQGKSSLFSRI